MPDQNAADIETRAVHAGELRDGSRAQPVVAPIAPSVGYTYPDTRELDAVLGGELPGFVYSPRYANPTVAAFESAVADLEGAPAACAFSSGMAAVHVALLAAGVRAGTTVVAALDLYGATYSLLADLLSSLGVRSRFVDVLDLSDVEAALLATKPVALLVETISNPLLKVANLPALARLAHEAGALFLVDNTFCSPYLCQPMAFGADMVIHSATKFLSGHGDVMGGVVATSEELKAELVALNKLVGSALGPFEAWLAHRGLKTLPLRLRQQCANAMAMALWLVEQPRVAVVNYPLLGDPKQVEMVNRLTHERGGGAVLSFAIRDAGRAQVFAFMDALRLVQPATSLGDIYSLLLYPAIASHRALPPETREAVGIGDNLVRLSVGIESLSDIRADLAQALAAI
jgi:cystathionine gamma-synthase/methionine-gamma-lyase